MISIPVDPPPIRHFHPCGSASKDPGRDPSRPDLAGPSPIAARARIPGRIFWSGSLSGIRSKRSALKDPPEIRPGPTSPDPPPDPARTRISPRIPGGGSFSTDLSRGSASRDPGRDPSRPGGGGGPSEVRLGRISPRIHESGSLRDPSERIRPQGSGERSARARPHLDLPRPWAETDPSPDP